MADSNLVYSELGTRYQRAYADEGMGNYEVFIWWAFAAFVSVFWRVIVMLVLLPPDMTSTLLYRCVPFASDAFLIFSYVIHIFRRHSTGVYHKIAQFRFMLLLIYIFSDIFATVNADVFDGLGPLPQIPISYILSLIAAISSYQSTRERFFIFLALADAVIVAGLIPFSVVHEGVIASIIVFFYRYITPFTLMVNLLLTGMYIRRMVKRDQASIEMI